MPALRAEAIVVAVRAHGEHGTVARFLTAEQGLVAAYVRGGRSRMMRPVLLVGNGVTIDWRARNAAEMGHAVVELRTSRGQWLSEPLAADAIGWVCALTATALPEDMPCPPVYDALGGLLDAICLAPSARRWVAALVRYELLLLAQMGFGLDLSACAVTGGCDDLAYVSPRTARAVSRAGAGGYAAQLLPLPSFLLGNAEPDWPDLVAGLRLSGHFIERQVGDPRRRGVMDARARLIERLARAAE